MSTGKNIDIEAWGSEDEPQWAVRTRDANVVEARAAVEREFGPFEGPPLRYLGIRVVHLKAEEAHRGRRNRVHLFTDEPE